MPRDTGRYPWHRHNYCIEIVQLWNDAPRGTHSLGLTIGERDAAVMLCAQRRPFVMLIATSSPLVHGSIGLNLECLNTVVFKLRSISVPMPRDTGRYPWH